ncbi:hypothetical protein ADEAN_000813000 [Angomonas deanei]|uniref:Uncharacterized protein n=1 Tax=Angomonas deanei TaxID=59799 RepID=A0A7G2CL73_9TRYP|nr:hypothetical protein ADEAN_000813000 [Angomonas deanei]
MSLATEPICVSVADGEADQQGVPAVIEKLNWSGLGISCLPCVHGSTPVTDSPHGSGEEMVCQTCRNLNLRNNLIETIFECNATHETSMVKNIALSAFVHLTFLDLTKNKIVSLDGIQKLNLLKSLRLAHNRIKSLSPIWETAADSTEEAEKKLVCSLEVLDVSYNALECIVSEEEIQRLAEHSRGGNAIPLRVLNADHNEVRDFFVPTCFSSLEVLNIRNNNIAEIGQQEESIETEGSLLFPLQEEFPQLIFLDLYDNPLSPAALRCITRSVDSYNTASPACARPHSLTLKIPDPEPEEGGGGGSFRGGGGPGGGKGSGRRRRRGGGGGGVPGRCPAEFAVGLVQEGSYSHATHPHHRPPGRQQKEGEQSAKE